MSETTDQIAKDIKLFRGAAGALGGLLVISTVYFHFIEKWSVFDSMYFSVVTMATVGYGDFTPKTDAGKLGAMVLIVLGIGLFGTFASLLIKRQSQIRESKQRQKQD
jgi:voltage-gated potassium channel Kch